MAEDVDSPEKQQQTNTTFLDWITQSTPAIKDAVQEGIDYVNRVLGNKVTDIVSEPLENSESKSTSSETKLFLPLIVRGGEKVDKVTLLSLPQMEPEGNDVSPHQ